MTRTTSTGGNAVCYVVDQDRVRSEFALSAGGLGLQEAELKVEGREGEGEHPAAGSTWAKAVEEVEFICVI
jgi:hypothetical protein